MEILITLIIVALAAYIIFKSVRKSSKGSGCNCGKCSSSCPVQKENIIKLEKK
ncbi:FeoB-associated Cys-rich membrane protein [Clostridium tertium]